MSNGRIIRHTQIGNKLPEIGKVKCGEKNQKGYPTSLDYFVGFGKYKEYFDKAYAEKPNRIQIIFYTDNIGECCNERMELRDKAGKLFGRGDGATFEIWDGKGYGAFNITEHPDILERTSKKCESPKGWERVLTLRFIIPAITGIYGAWALETKADKSSIDQIVGVFDEVLSQAGTVRRICFDLTVKKHKSQKPDDKSSYPVINLIPNVSEENLTKVKAYFEHNKNVTMITDEVLKSVPQLADGTDKKDEVKSPFDY